MSKRVIHELSLDDLLALAEGSKSAVEVEEKLTHAAKFIYDLGIKHGDTQVPASLIYFHYKLWRGWGHKRQSKPFFFRDFSKYFDPHRVASGMTYYLNPKPFDFSEETKWLIRAQERNEKIQRKAKKKT